MQMHNPPHPGLLVREAMGERLTVAALARHLKVPRENLSKILNGRQSISAAVALKLSEAFPNQDAEFWLRLQNQYDLGHLRKKKRARIKPLAYAAAA
jgi:addiction module HigA family antidote